MNQLLENDTTVTLYDFQCPITPGFVFDAVINVRKAYDPINGEYGYHQRQSIACQAMDLRKAALDLDTCRKICSPKITERLNHL